MELVAAEDDLFENLSDRELRGQLRGALEAALEPREREIMLLRYGLCGEKPLTQRETAGRLGISRSYVSRLEKGALEKLRAWLAR